MKHPKKKVSRMLACLAAIALAGCSGGGASGNGAAAAEGGPNGTGGFGPSSAQVQQAGCDRMLVGGRPPSFANEKLAANTQVMCNRSYVSLYSGLVRTPLWSAEYLTQGALIARRGIERIDDFHPDDRVHDGPTLADYKRSGYDRGHLSPDADMPSREAEQESFALTNIAPQNPTFNRGSWAKLEGSVRRQTKGGPIYIVTGVIYSTTKVQATHDDGRVKVPEYFYKALYSEGRGATVFVATNEEDAHYQNMTVDQFTTVYGIDPFPGIDPKYRKTNAAADGDLRVSTKRGRGHGRGGYGSGGYGGNGYGNAAGDGQQQGGQQQGNGSNNLVMDPLDGQWETVDTYRQRNHRDP